MAVHERGFRLERKLPLLSLPSVNTIMENNEVLFASDQATKLLIIATVQRFLAIESACGYKLGLFQALCAFVH